MLALAQKQELVRKFTHVASHRVTAPLYSETATEQWLETEEFADATEKVSYKASWCHL